jgi:arsenate reductase
MQPWREKVPDLGYIAGSIGPFETLMSEFTIYHNPRCTKSRATLSLLREHGIEPKVVEYLQDTPSAAELEAIAGKLGIKPEALVRKGEDVYKSKYAGRTLTDAQWIEAMVKDPILIERPIVVSGRRAVIGRPPENVKPLIGTKGSRQR